MRRSLYNVWYQMLLRCENPDNHNFRHYGGRGIAVCERWHTFANFVADMGVRPIGTTLDRIDHDGDYEPGNCRWIDRRGQANNTRANIYVVIRGQRMTMAEAADRHGIDKRLFWARIQTLGWSAEKAAITPVKPKRRYVHWTHRQ